MFGFDCTLFVVCACNYRNGYKTTRGSFFVIKFLLLTNAITSAKNVKRADKDFTITF